MWDANRMKLVCVNDTTKNTPQSKAVKKIIYGVSWHPHSTKLAAVTVNGNCLIYDALKGKLLSHCTPREDTPSFRVDWNKLEPKSLVMSSKAELVYYLEVEDPNVCKDLKIVKAYKHPSAVFGVQWDPFNRNHFISGCNDWNVRLFDVTSNSENPIKTFQGHSDRVYNVLYSPELEGICVSGSDDLSIRVWDVSSDQYSAINVLGEQSSTDGHTNNVRALAFVPEISWCLLSGAWDSTIKMWDIRSGRCMTTIKDHNSDVYAICFNPSRPFTFASCSRDTTIRLFSIDGMISSLKMQLLHG